MSWFYQDIYIGHGEEHKLQHYHQLWIEFKRLRKVNVEVIPIVIRASRVTKPIKQYVQKLSPTIRIYFHQNWATVHMASIVRWIKCQKPWIMGLTLPTGLDLNWTFESNIWLSVWIFCRKIAKNLNCGIIIHYNHIVNQEHPKPPHDANGTLCKQGNTVLHHRLHWTCRRCTSDWKIWFNEHKCVFVKIHQMHVFLEFY